MTGNAVFIFIYTIVENPLLDNLQQIMTALVAYASTPVQTSLVLYMALTGILMLRGHASEAVGSLFSRFIKMTIVVWFATNGAVYTTWVRDFFLTTLPNDISNAVTASMGGSPAISANSFDTVLLKSFDAGLQVWKLLKWYNFGEQIFVVLFWVIAIFSCVVMFSIWFISHISLAVFVSIAPLMLPLVLFPVTKPIFERWIGAMISAVIVQVVTVILLTLTLEVEGQLVTQLASYTGTNPDAQIRTLIAAVAFFGFAALLAFQIPGFGTALSGGLHFHTGAIARAALGVATGGASTVAQKASAMGAKVDATALAGARQVYRRIRPPVGGSLSKGNPPLT